MRTLNLGILAHVDAGKTSLTERLLHAAGVIDEIGRVDDGSTQTDTLALERQRGITIKAAVVSFVIGDVTVNLIDTPGHPDFIAEVERVLGVLDGAVLVVSAVEGVQAQTRILMRTLNRLRIPTLIFVNKVDRAGARDDAVVGAIAEALTPAVVPMGWVSEVGTRAVAVHPYDHRHDAFTARLVDLLSERDDGLVASYVDGEELPYRRLRRALARQTRIALVHPVFFGSAVTGAGLDPLMAGLTELLPATEGDGRGPAAGIVFKIERGPSGEKLAVVRLFSGAVRTRAVVTVAGGEAKVTGIEVFELGARVRRSRLGAGQIGTLRGLGDVRIGDPIGAHAASGPRQFAPPTLETVVVAGAAAERGALHVALTRLAEQDPLINLRHDEVRGETSVSLYGEVQKEVIRDTLAAESGLQVEFRESTTICIERPVGTGVAVEEIPSGRSPEHPFLAGVGLRVEPADIDSGIDFRLEIERGSLPAALLTAVQETVPVTLEQGLHGWQVTGCTVTFTSSAYWPRQSHAHATFDKNMSSIASDFRHLTPLVLMSALRGAGTVVLEPVHRFRLEIPADTIGSVLPVLARLDSVPEAPVVDGSTAALTGLVPAARVHELQQRLPGLTRGDGVVECAFDSYRPVRGETPTRPRTDHNPLDRDEYLRHVVGRV